MAEEYNTSLPPSPAIPNADNVLTQQPNTDFDINNVYIKVKGSNFVYNDSQDSGVGCWMDKTNNVNIIGASLPILTTKHLFGAQSKAKHKLVEIHNPLTQKTVIVPLVDVGPNSRVQYGIDLTYNCYVSLGGELVQRGGKIVGGDRLSTVYYRILSPAEQMQFAHLTNGYGGAQHIINSPMRNLQNNVDLVAGVNFQRDQAISQLVNGHIPDYPKMVDNGSHGTGGEAGSESNVIHTTTNLAPSPVNTSGMPSGMFSVPEVGAMLWVFFRNGDPMFPVYFAASYGQAEWQQAYSASSPPLNYPGTDPTKLSKNDGAFMVPNKGGGIHCVENVTEDGIDNNRGIKLFGYSGAHMEFNENHNIYYSPHDDYHQSDGHKFDVVHSNREMFTRGDSNTVTLGDHFIKVGNISKSAFEAMDHIHDIVNDINDKMLGKTTQTPTQGGEAAHTTASTI